MSDLKRKTLAGAAWMVSMQFTVTVLGLCSTVVLARLLTPNDFGIVALAGTAYTFFMMFGQFGFDAALIQFKNPTKEHYNTAWTCNILVGVAVALAMIGVASPAADFYREPKIENVVYSFAFLSLAKGFENIGVVNFRKDLTFGAEYLYFVLPKLASIFVGVGSAFVLRSHWALVFGMLASQSAKLVYSFVAQPFRPRLSVSGFRELFQFTRWVLMSRVLHFFSVDGLDLILGRLRDASAVGSFGIARQIAFLPSTEVLAPINRALFPSFATISEDTERLRGIFYQVFAMTALISVPAAFGILAVAETLVQVAFGAAWESVGPLLSVLGFIGAIEATKSLLRPLLLARGIPKVTTFVLAVYVIVVIPMTIVLVGRIGTIGVTYSMLTGSVVSIPIFLVAARREVGIRAGRIMGYVWRPLVGGMCMAATVREMSSRVGASVDPGLDTLLLLILTGIITYTVVVVGLWGVAGRPDGAERAVFRLLGEAAKWLRRRVGKLYS